MPSITSTLQSPRVILSAAIATITLVIGYSLISSFRGFALAGFAVQLLIILSPIALASIVLWLGVRSRHQYALTLAITMSFSMAALFTTLNMLVSDWLAGILLFPMTLGLVALGQIIVSDVKRTWIKACLLLLTPIVLWIVKIGAAMWFFYSQHA